MYVAGLEIVRRDNCGLVRRVLSRCLDMILMHRDVDGAVRYVQGTVRELLLDEVDLSDLIITKTLNKIGDDMKAVQAHVVLAERMMQRDANSAPKLGDRVQFVYVQSHKKAKGFEKVEDPLYVLENKLTIDVNYYIEHQLKLPLVRLFEPILEKAERVLFSGDHTMVKKQSTPDSNFGIMRFVSKRSRCMGCKFPLPVSSSGTLCKGCAANGQEIYSALLDKANASALEYQKLWTNCQRCQVQLFVLLKLFSRLTFFLKGSLHQPVLCNNNDCPVFFRRVKARTVCNEHQEQLRSFDF